MHDIDSRCIGNMSSPRTQLSCKPDTEVMHSHQVCHNMHTTGYCFNIQVSYVFIDLNHLYQHCNVGPENLTILSTEFLRVDVKIMNITKQL